MAATRTKLLSFLLFTFLAVTVSGQQQNFRFKAQLEKDAFTPVSFAVKNTTGLLEKLLKETAVGVKSVTPEWIYIQASPDWIDKSQTSGLIEQFYFELSFPVALNDSARGNHFVDQVHAGTGGLPSPFTGKNVIIGYVDQGLDYTHPDFIDSNGESRVLYYWDHSAPFNAVRTPAPYNYGQLWHKSDIDAGTCGAQEETTAHGTTVAGSGSGNGRANGTNKGMAPDSKIIMVETDLNLPNWTLTVADACDFIFKKADSLGMPAVVNLSVGSYLGSHDGNDPASILMEQMLDTQPGRIIVSAAGNSGAWGKYHVGKEVNADTSFTWFQNNPSGALGNNTIYFDLWSDAGDATWNYALAANLPGGTFAQRATTLFRPAPTGIGSTPVRDTLYNGTNRIAILELYPEMIDGNYHLEVYFSHVDSTAYNFSFKTTGSGHYDLWSGTTLGLNNIVTTVPSAGVYPPIAHYIQPDTLQSVVSSWNCSEKVVSVGNLRNRYGHIDRNGDQYVQPTTVAVHQISLGSSKGPSRHGLIKPDISASGDVALSASPLWLLANPGLNSLIDSGGWHVRNGGTSMASPVVAGIAALYLEKCHNASYQSFKNEMASTAYTDGFTGTVPNNAYGYGKIHALDLLLGSNYNVSVNGPAQYCGSQDTANVVTSVVLSSVLWNTESENFYTTIDSAGSYSFAAYNSNGCIAYSDTLVVIGGDIPPVPVITVVGTTLSTADYPNLQWYQDGIAVAGATNDTLVIIPGAANYTVEATGTTGCISSSEAYNPSAGLFEGEPAYFTVYPNPSAGELTILSEKVIDSKMIFDIQGKCLKNKQDSSPEIDISDLSPGSYFLLITSGGSSGWTKIIKN